jgi:hypothetical protein
LEDEDSKLREHSANALERIGRADCNLILPYLGKLMKMKEDRVDNVRLAFVCIWGRTLFVYLGTDPFHSHQQSVR